MLETIKAFGLGILVAALFLGATFYATRIYAYDSGGTGGTCIGQDCCATCNNCDQPYFDPTVPGHVCSKGNGIPNDPIDPWCGKTGEECELCTGYCDETPAGNNVNNYECVCEE